MDTQILNDIVSTFVQALQTGTTTLTGYAFALLAITATIAVYFQIGPQLANGGIGLGDALGSLVLLVLKIGLVYWVMLHLPSLADAAFRTFVQWGAAAGGALTRTNFLSPGEIVDTGFRVARPIRDMTDNVWSWLSHDPVMLIAYSLAYYAIVLGFVFVALGLALTIIEFNLAVMAGVILIPWSLFPALTFLGEFALGWIVGGLVRALLTAAMVGVGLPLFSGLKLTFSSGGDPTFYSGLVCGIVSLIFAVLAWVVPAKAGNVAGRGVGAALGASDVLAGAASGARVAMLGSRAALGTITGTSRLVQGAAQLRTHFRSGRGGQP